MGLINRKPNIGALRRAGDVDGLTEALHHKTEDVRESAARAIQDLFATAQEDRIDAITKTLIKKPEVTERLVAASKDSNATVRWGAIWALGFVWYVNKQVLGNIIEALNDPNSSVRGAAAVALTNKKDDATLRSLTTARNAETEPHALKAMSDALERMRNLPEARDAGDDLTRPVAAKDEMPAGVEGAPSGQATGSEQPTPASSLDSSFAALIGDDHEARKAAIAWLVARGYQDPDEPRTLQDLHDPMNWDQEALERDLREQPDFDAVYVRAAYPTMHSEDHAHANAAILRDGVVRCRRKSYVLARLCSYCTWQEDWIAALDYAVAAVVIGDPSQGPGDMVQVMELLSLTFKRTANTECPRWEDLVSDAVAVDRIKASYDLGEVEATAVLTTARQLAGQHAEEVIWAADMVRKKLSERKAQGM